jgi:hypothetical protein
MQDVTDLFFEYLEAKRHIWNTHFVNKAISLRECRFLDAYEEIDRQLFAGLVLDELRLPRLPREHVFGVTPMDTFMVSPKGETVAVMAGDPQAGSRNTQFRSPVVIETAESVFSFIEFFEWDRYSYVSYPYVLVRAIKCPAMPDLVSKDCLIETKDVKLFLRG